MIMIIQDQEIDELKEIIQNHITDLVFLSSEFNDIHKALEVIGLDKLSKSIMDIDKHLNSITNNFYHKLEKVGMIK